MSMYVLGILASWFKRVVLTLFILNSVPVGQASQDLSRSRLNAGMTFKHHTTLTVSQSLWRVTFSVPLPKLGLGGEDSPFQSARFTDISMNDRAQCVKKVAIHAHFGLNAALDHCGRFVENILFIRTTANRARKTLQNIARS